MSIADKKQQLLRLLKEKSFRYSPDRLFKLASGREIPYYTDCRLVTHSAKGLALIGEIFFELIKDLKVNAIGGPTMSADPLAHATALISFQKGNPINAFSIRKFTKKHGTGGVIVGDMHSCDRVVIVEDVVTAGRSILKAIQAAQEFGLEVIKVLILVDREEGGRQEIEKLVSQVEVVFSLTDQMK